MRSQILLCIYALCLLCLVSTARTAGAQLPGSQEHGVNPSTDAEETRDRMVHDMEKKAAKERVAALKSDTDKLLKLSTELKAYVDKSNENILSLDVIKKADEIEKLARSVKDKMKGPN